jgi:tRNA-specific 2-thiouridylase
MCNKEIKFKLLYKWAMDRGFDFLGTGHYAQLKTNKSLFDDRQKVISKLLRSVDEFKDQTYFIYNIKTEQLPHLLFPIGGMKKSDVRSLARKIKLPNAEKKESMGLCFVGRIRLRDFLNQKLKPRAGDIIDQDGNKIGRHQGLHYYTIGQRQGIAAGARGPYYVFEKDLKRNRLYVTNNPEDEKLLTGEVVIHSVNFLIQQSSALGGSNQKLLGRYRHQGDLVPLTISKIDRGNYQIKFKKPQKAIASGQSLVLYAGKQCLGGGVIN